MSSTSFPSPVTGSRPPQQQPNQADSDAEQIPFEDQSFFGKTVARMSAAWLCSMFLHLFLLIALALFTFAQLKKDETISLAMGDSSEPIDTMLEMPLEMEDFEEMEEPVEQLDLVVEDQLDDSLMKTDLLADLPLESAEVSMDFGDLGAELTEIGGGTGTGTEGFANSSNSKFFKSGGPMAKTVVYIVDNSNSMTGMGPRANGYGRMETALVELAKSVNSLQPEQRFYIILYSDTAYGLYYPQTATNYVKANTQNKYLVQQWLQTVECCLYTEGEVAFEKARQLKPELIYLLGDGNFTDKAAQKIIKNPIKGARLEALGMNLKGGGKKNFEAIAKAHGGSYRDVTLTEDGKAILQQYGPRPANWKNGQVWGIYIDQLKKLKQMGRKKKKKK